MINKSHLPILIFSSITVTIMYLWYSGSKTPKALSVDSSTTVAPALKVDFKAPARVPASIPKNPPKAKITYTTPGASHPVWEEKIEKNLLAQAAGTLKEAHIEKVDSFNWKVGKVDVLVDSIIVKLEHTKGHRSSFRAIVDASNGKILQTWDHPVLDNFNPKTRFGVKVDSRYHND